MLKTLIFICVFIALTAQNAPPLIKIKQGTLRGAFRKSLNGRDFSSFTGIPYAEPPIGELRFKTPVPARSWKGVLDATMSHAICPQVNVFTGNYNFTGDEDCLYLNIYTPQIGLSSNQELLPVMFFIHGGGFTCGEANTYSPDNFLDYNVILVTINYRLGALGFLVTSKDGVISGNNGLKDQNLALKWIKDNIVYFGGNPDNIIIFGHSAGAISAHYHMLSPLSKNLIKGVIIQSGSALAPYSLGSRKTMLENTKKLAKLLDCPSTPSEALIACLRKVSASEIINQDVHFMKWSYFPLVPFKPVIETESDEAFLTEEPAIIIKKNKAAKVPMMIGLTTEDGAMFTADIFKKKKLVEDLNSNFNKAMPFLLLYEESNSNRNELLERVRLLYLGNHKIDENSKNNITKMITDVWFHLPVYDTVMLHTQYTHQNVYYYIFGYPGTQSFTLLFSDIHDKHNYGVCHGDELFYLFNLKFDPNKEFTEDELKMNSILSFLWTSFAKTNNPTPNTNEIISTIWNPVKTSNMEYYLINKKPEMKNDINLERLQFWKNVSFNSRSNKIRDEL